MDRIERLKNLLSKIKNNEVLIIDKKKMYSIDDKGNRKFIKDIPKIKSNIPKTFEII